VSFFAMAFPSAAFLISLLITLLILCPLFLGELLDLMAFL
jgi:hypothetical protein